MARERRYVVLRKGGEVAFSKGFDRADALRRLEIEGRNEALGTKPFQPNRSRTSLPHMPDSLSPDQFLELLRGATEDDIDAAMEGALFDMPINNTAELLEVYNRILDVLTGHADAAHAMDMARIASAAEQKSGSD